MRRRTKLVVATLVVAVGACIGGAVVWAGGGGGNGVATSASPATPAVTGTCAVGKQSFASHVDQNGTTSTTFVNIPGATVTFTAGAKAKCITVNFTSMAFAPGSSIVFVRALLDGSIAGEPAETQFAGNDGSVATSHAMNFLFPSVGAGAHTVQMQFRSNGGNVFIHRGTTTVFYK